MTDRDVLLDLAGRALAASEAGTTLFVSPEEFRLLKTMNEREWDTVVLTVWEAALRNHPKSPEILSGVIGQPWALPVVVRYPPHSGASEISGDDSPRYSGDVNAEAGEGNWR